MAGQERLEGIFTPNMVPLDAFGPMLRRLLDLRQTVERLS